MPTEKFLIVLCLFLFSKIYGAHSEEICIVLEAPGNFEGSAEITTLIEMQELSLKKERPTPLLQLFHRKQKHNKKLTAALLAFPLPFGIVGLHRIYLGSAPYVPVVYIASFGGVLGLLPLIDFCFILLEKDLKVYENNKKVFMWVK